MNITIGQYFPLNSPVHRLDARVKLILTLLFIVTIFFVQGVWSHVICFLFLLAVIKLSRLSLSVIVKSLKPLLFVIAFTCILNLFYSQGEPLWQWWIFKITSEGIITAARMGLRIILLVAGSSLLTYTTSPIMLTDAMESLLAPLKLFKVPVADLAMMMSIALRFIPTLMEETTKIIQAQKARGANFETGGLVSRARALVPVLVPLFVSAFRRADELSLAMEARGYIGDTVRTRLKPMQCHAGDVIALFFVIFFFAGIAVLGKLGY